MKTHENPKTNPIKITRKSHENPTYKIPMKIPMKIPCKSHEHPPPKKKPMKVPVKSDENPIKIPFKRN